MKYLVDTDWVVDYLAGKQQALSLLSSVWQDGIAISLITLGEIYEGIYYGHDPQRSEAVFRQFLRSVDVLSLNRSIMQRFGRVRVICVGEGSLSVIPIFSLPPLFSITISPF